MGGLRLRQLRLTAFKTYHGVSIPLSPLTVLIGRNGSGKSNALDALEILSRFAAGDDVRDALDGNRKDQPAIRGGVEGCAPNGGDSFELGVTVADNDKYAMATQWAELDISIQVRPEIRILSEKFVALLPKSRKRVTILESQSPDPDRSDLFAEVFNGRPGANPRRAFRSTHLLTSQLPLRLAGESVAEREVIDVANVALSAIAGVFHLDPVPHLMRDYVAEQDSILRRTGENLSAAVAAMQKDDRDRFNDLIQIVKLLPENEIRGLEVRRGGFGDVMIALRERRGRGSEVIPARQMSDGMLRMLAIATALLSGGGGLALDKTLDGSDSPPLCLVLEELENGLHPSQAARVLDLVRRSSAERQFQVVMTTHSPALLNALTGDEHPGVLICERERTFGASNVRRLVDIPGYLGLMAEGRLGDSVASDRFASALVDRPPVDLRTVLGVG